MTINPNGSQWRQSVSQTAENIKGKEHLYGSSSITKGTENLKGAKNFGKYLGKIFENFTNTLHLKFVRIVNLFSQGQWVNNKTAYKELHSRVSELTTLLEKEKITAEEREDINLGIGEMREVCTLLRKAKGKNQNEGKNILAVESELVKLERNAKLEKKERSSVPSEVRKGESKVSHPEERGRSPIRHERKVGRSHSLGVKTRENMEMDKKSRSHSVGAKRETFSADSEEASEEIGVEERGRSPIRHERQAGRSHSLGVKTRENMEVDKKSRSHSVGAKRDTFSSNSEDASEEMGVEERGRSPIRHERQAGKSHSPKGAKASDDTKSARADKAARDGELEALRKTHQGNVEKTARKLEQRLGTEKRYVLSESSSEENSDIDVRASRKEAHHKTKAKAARKRIKEAAGSGQLVVHGEAEKRIKAGPGSGQMVVFGGDKERSVERQEKIEAIQKAFRGLVEEAQRDKSFQSTLGYWLGSYSKENRELDELGKTAYEGDHISDGLRLLEKGYGDYLPDHVQTTIDNIDGALGSLFEDISKEIYMKLNECMNMINKHKDFKFSSYDAGRFSEIAKKDFREPNRAKKIFQDIETVLEISEKAMNQSPKLKSVVGEFIRVATEQLDELKDEFIYC